MEKKQLEPGAIVQLSPFDTRNTMLAGCLFTVTEAKEFGAQGYIQMTGADGKPGGQVYYRATWEEMEETGGHAPWVVGGE